MRSYGHQHRESREKLVEVIDGITSLAKELGKKDVALSGEDERLHSPFRIVVCGDKQAGKTSLIRALFSLKDSETSRSQDGLHLYESATMVVIESPATSQLTEDARNALQREIQRADYVLWCLPVLNPWAASTWDLIAEQSEETLALSSLVLLQCDLRTDTELSLLEGHVRDLCRQRTQRLLDLRFLSCLDAQQAGVDSCQVMLNSELNRSRRRRTELREVYQIAYTLMMELETYMDERASTIESDKGYLESIEAEIERDKGLKVEQYTSDFTKWGELYETVLLPTLKVVRRKTGVLAVSLSLFGKGNDAIQIEGEFLDLVEEKAGEQGLLDGKELLNSCKKNWLDLKPHLEQRLALDIGELEESAFLDQVKHLSERLAKRARHSVVRLRIRRVLDELLMEKRGREKSLLALYFSFITLAGVTGTFELGSHPWPALSLLAAAGVLFAIYCTTILKSQKTIVETYGGGLIDLRATFAESVITEYQDGIHEFYKGYLPMLENLKRHIASAKKHLIPRQQRWGDLFLELRAIEQEL